MIIKNLNLSLGTQIIFKDCNLRLDDNCKVGLIGINGAGKTTLFKLITKQLSPDSGEIILMKNSRIGYLPQTIDFNQINPNITVLEYIKSGRPIEQLETKLHLIEETLSKNDTNVDNLLREYSKISSLLDFWDRYEADSILEKIIKGMNINEELLNQELSSLSGGEKSKIAFAKLLYSKPTTLLLDEPTNHLDKESREWCIEYLKSYKGQVLIISHDYDFLDSIVDKILFIDKQSHNISLYNGNYTTFKKIYEEIKLSNSRLVKKQEDEESKLLKIIKSFDGASGKRKKMAFSKEKALERLRRDKVERIEDARIANIQLIADEDQNKTPLSIQNLTFSYDSNTLLKNINLSISSKERILIAGNNGVGKSTLLKLIVKELKPKNGEIFIGSKTKIAYYDQEQFEINNTDKTILEYFEHLGHTQKEIRAVLSRYLFWGDQLEKRISVLSPGEKCRLSFAKLSLKRSNLMILDEPTNHLDFDTQNTIANNLNEYNGTIILVSHNPDFVEKLNIDKMFILPKGKMIYYDRSLLEKIQEYNENELYI